MGATATMNYGLCDKCYGFVYFLFHPSRYQPFRVMGDPDTDPNSLMQRYCYLDHHEHISKLAEACKLCALVKRKMPTKEDWLRNGGSWPLTPETDPSMQMELTGGNVFRPASKDQGLQLWRMRIAMSYGIGRWDTPYSVTFSITAPRGMAFL